MHPLLEQAYEIYLMGAGRLKARFAELDGELKPALDDVGARAKSGDTASGNPEIDRGGWQLSAGARLHTLREALIITMGKAVVYLRAMDRPIPAEVRGWVG